jgi:pimeloyl-ACP methyl ester carboxylesterase
VKLAGWYIPAGDGTPATGPTVVLAHGWGSNKSNMLDRAAVIHDRYNVLLFDFRNHGQSSDAMTTQGVREADDLRAMIDWLEREKQPEAIAVLGVSMGGATALAEATGDDRVAAVIAESTHATLAHAAQARLDRGGYPLSMPGSWAVLLGSLMRTGEDVSAVDPISSARRLDERPLLVIHGALDASIGPGDADAIAAAAEEAGSPVELRVCDDGGHADVHEVCAKEYPGWVLGFLERVLGPAA